MGLQLYWHPFSLFPRRVRIALREKSIAHEEIEVDVPGGATRAAAFRRLNPFGQVPVIDHDGVVVHDSVAILEYLEECFPTPALLPASAPRRAEVRQWLLASGNHCAPPFKRWLTRLFTPESAWDRADQARAVDELDAHLAILDARLADRQYLAGDFSLAEVGYAPLVCELEACGLAHLLGAHASVAAWVERLRARPAVRATQPGRT